MRGLTKGSGERSVNGDWRMGRVGAMLAWVYGVELGEDESVLMREREIRGLGLRSACLRPLKRAAVMLVLRVYETGEDGVVLQRVVLDLELRSALSCLRPLKTGVVLVW